MSSTPQAFAVVVEFEVTAYLPLEVYAANKEEAQCRAIEKIESEISMREALASARLAFLDVKQESSPSPPTVFELGEFLASRDGWRLLRATPSHTTRYGGSGVV